MLFQIEVENNAYETCPETQSFSKHWTTVSLAWISHEIGWIRNTHYLSVPVGWYPSYLFHHGLALQSCTCMWKHCVWGGLSLLNCKSYPPDWFLFEPEALLLSLISTLPGLQQDPRLPTCLKIPWSTELIAQFRLWIHTACSVTGSCDSSSTAHQKLLGLMEFLMKKSCRMQ